MARMLTVITTLSLFLIGFHAETVALGEDREAKFLGMPTSSKSSNCFVGLKELEGKVDHALVNLKNLVTQFRKLMTTVSSISAEGGSCSGGGGNSSRFVFAPDNSVTLNNSNNITNEDIFIYNNTKIIRINPVPPVTSAPATTGAPGTDTTTTPATSTTTAPTTTTAMSTSTTTACMPDPTMNCLDITSILMGATIESVFTAFTTMADNSPNKCAAFCQLWGFTFGITATLTACYCTNMDLLSNCALPRVTCAGICPGTGPTAGTGSCGGILPLSVNVYRADQVTPAMATAFFPSGKCFVPTLMAGGALVADKLTTYPLVGPPVTLLSATECATNCRTSTPSYTYSCTYGTFCGCYTDASRPMVIAPIQTACITPCPGNTAETCGAVPPILAYNCRHT